MRQMTVSMMLVLGIVSASAADFELAGGQLSVKGSVTAGTAYRTDSQDTALTPNVNSSQVGIVGSAITATAGRNQDDGNLNFSKGHPVSQVVNGYLSMEYRSGTYGGLFSAKAWYDYLLEKGDVPWGNSPNGYAPNGPLSDAGAQPRSKFSGVALDNLYVNGRNDIGGAPLEWKLGWQKLDWGNRYLVVGGLRDLNPIDIPALTRPGMLQRDQETRIPVPQLVARLAVTSSTSLEGFYQFHFERHAANQCGTFYSGADWTADGCNAVVFGNQTDRAAIATNNFIHRTDNVVPSDTGQFGLAVTQSVEQWATKFGLYLTQFHSRAGFASFNTSGRTAGAPYVPGNADGLNPTYFLEWPADVRMVGLTFETTFKGGTAFGELTYQAEPAAPIQCGRPAERGGVDHRSDATARPRERPAARRGSRRLRAAQGGATAARRRRPTPRRAGRNRDELGRRDRLQGHPGPARSQRPALRAVGHFRAGSREWRLPAARRAVAVHERWVCLAPRLGLPQRAGPALRQRLRRCRSGPLDALRPGSARLVGRRRGLARPQSGHPVVAGEFPQRLRR